MEQILNAIGQTLDMLTNQWVQLASIDSPLLTIGLGFTALSLAIGIYKILKRH